jgi:hypothetical protein
MQIEKDNNWASDVEDSDSIDSQDTVSSSTYASVLGSPLRSENGFEVDISFPQDDMQNGWRDGSLELNISSSPEKVADGSAQRLELNGSKPVDTVKRSRSQGRRKKKVCSIHCYDIIFKLYYRTKRGRSRLSSCHSRFQNSRKNLKIFCTRIILLLLLQMKMKLRWLKRRQ